MRGAIYAKYSSDNQREESIEGQIREYTAYAKKNGINIVGTYIDRAYSAKTDNRPEFQRMIKDSAKKGFDVVIVWKLDRFSRNRYDSARYKAMLRKNDVKVVSATESKKIWICVGVFLLLLIITWGICETAGSDYYNYKGYVVDVIEENGDTILVTVSGNVESRFSLKWYSREKFKKDTKNIEIGDLVMLSTTHFSDTNIKKFRLTTDSQPKASWYILTNYPTHRLFWQPNQQPR